MKRRSEVEYIGSLLNENMSGEAMARMILKRLIQKRNVLIDKVDVYHILPKECYATL